MKWSPTDIILRIESRWLPLDNPFHQISQILGVVIVRVVTGGFVEDGCTIPVVPVVFAT